jgi:hypothetical protein
MVFLITLLKQKVLISYEISINSNILGSYFIYFHIPKFWDVTAIVGDLAPQVELLSSMRMTPLLPIQQPYLSDLMASIKVIGKLCSGVKNSRMGKLWDKVLKMVSKTLE